MELINVRFWDGEFIEFWDRVFMYMAPPTPVVTVMRALLSIHYLVVCLWSKVCSGISHGSL